MVHRRDHLSHSMRNISQPAVRVGVSGLLSVIVCADHLSHSMRNISQPAVRVGMRGLLSVIVRADHGPTERHLSHSMRNISQPAVRVAVSGLLPVIDCYPSRSMVGTGFSDLSTSELCRTARGEESLSAVCVAGPPAYHALFVTSTSLPWRAF
ncbi:hypothetical protein J6590_060120 [Homalodisca vitripennis]|nr:hypothetical protein J6590_060120 [Homalodisca vitripennis]